MNPFKILIFAVVVNSAFAAEASKDVNLTANAPRNQKEIKILETLCGSILPFSHSLMRATSGQAFGRKQRILR